MSYSFSPSYGFDTAYNRPLQGNINDYTGKRFVNPSPGYTPDVFRDVELPVPGSEFGVARRDESGLFGFVDKLGSIAPGVANAYRAMRGFPANPAFEPQGTRYAGDRLGRELAERRNRRQNQPMRERPGARDVAQAVAESDFSPFNTAILREAIASPTALQRLFTGGVTSTIDPARTSVALVESEDLSQTAALPADYYSSLVS